MAFTQNNSSSKIVNLQYSATLGLLYMATKENQDLLKKVKAEIGDDNWKKGYQGPNSQAVTVAKANGLVGGNVDGTLTSVYIDTKNDGGRDDHYLKVGLKDGDTRYFISVAISSEAGQKLARKLANAEIGVKTQVSLFASYEKKEGASRAYGSHGASVKQDGREIVSVDPQTNLVPAINAAVEALKGVGIDDKETIGKRKQKVSMDWHIDLVRQMEERVKVHYAQRDIPAEETADEAA